jgi:hypothetical protein
MENSQGEGTDRPGLITSLRPIRTGKKQLDVHGLILVKSVVMIAKVVSRRPNGY